jgi:hypothetical protein
MAAVALAAVSVAAPPAGAQQTPASQAPAVELVALLEARKLDAIAARLPSNPDVFVAALHFPGQLLVVWAEYPVPALLNEKLLRGDYRDIYIDLNSASDPATKTLVTDMGANGLRPRRNGSDDPFDMQDTPTGSIRFDGRWRDQKLSEQEYMRIYAEADKAYAEALNALLGQLRQGE